MQTFRSRHALATCAATFLALTALLAAPISTSNAQIRPLPTTKNLTNPTSIHPHIVPLYADATPVSAGLPACMTGTAVVNCYSPQQIRRAYAIQPLLDAGITGRGQTIVIIDFFQSPTLKIDLHVFDQLFNLKDPRLTIFTPSGTLPFDASDPGQSVAALETNLDVEWAHAIAPDATIDLVLARTDQNNDIYQATKFAIEHNLGDVISQSFGGSETCQPDNFVAKEHALFEEARAKDISVFASAGDSGSNVFVCNPGSSGLVASAGPGVEYPASDPLVTSVGGTRLLLTESGEYKSESVWNDTRARDGAGATGGGFSVIFPRPDYQNSIPGISSMRGLPDVTYDGDPVTGFPVVSSTVFPGVTTILPIGGTSAGTPQWAAITALANQHKAKHRGFLNGTLYRIGKSKLYPQTFHDITVGNNSATLSTKDGSITIPGYTAQPGWDAASGLGSPITHDLLNILAST